MQKTQVLSLGLEDPLEKEMTTHSRILALELPSTEEPGRLQSIASQRVRQDLTTKQQQYVYVWLIHFAAQQKLTVKQLHCKKINLKKYSV